MKWTADHATAVWWKSVGFRSLSGRKILLYDFENVVIFLESTPPASVFKLERKIRLRRPKTHFRDFVCGKLDGNFVPHSLDEI